MDVRREAGRRQTGHHADGMNAFHRLSLPVQDGMSKIYLLPDDPLLA
jgi:hypothetical protein